MKNIDASIKKFIELELELQDYNKFDNLKNADFDVNHTLKLGKQINKHLKIILRDDEGIEKFSNLLNHKNLFIAGIVARYLYPLYPAECLKVFKKYAQIAEDKLACKNVIEGLVQSLPVFIEQFKDLYGEKRYNQLTKI